MISRTMRTAMLASRRDSRNRRPGGVSFNSRLNRSLSASGMTLSLSDRLLAWLCDETYMDFLSTLEWQRSNSSHINRLAKLGDKLAKRLITAYIDLYGDQLNPTKQSEWMAICDDFCRRELLLTTRRIVQDRYGAKIPSEYRNLKVN